MEKAKEITYLISSLSNARAAVAISQFVGNSENVETNTRITVQIENELEKALAEYIK